MDDDDIYFGDGDGDGDGSIGGSGDGDSIDGSDDVTSDGDLESVKDDELYMKKKVKKTHNDKDVEGGGGKGNRKKKLQYPFFQSMADHTSDIFWKEIMIKCAYNKFPRGIIYFDNKISLKCSNNKLSSVHLFSDPKEASAQFINICQKKNILSTTDCDTRMTFTNKFCEKTVGCYEKGFKDVNTKRGKKHLIGDYVINNYSHLSPTQTICLYNNLVNILMVTRELSQEHVVFSDKEIKEIKGIEVQSNGSVIIHPNYVTKQVEKPTQQKTMTSIWKRYVEKTTKKKIKIT